MYIFSELVLFCWRRYKASVKRLEVVSLELFCKKLFGVPIVNDATTQMQHCHADGQLKVENKCELRHVAFFFLFPLIGYGFGLVKRFSNLIQTIVVLSTRELWHLIKNNFNCLKCVPSHLKNCSMHSSTRGTTKVKIIRS